MSKTIDTDERMPISKWAFGIMAFFLGALGAHDFAAKRYLYGLMHAVLTILAVVIFYFSQSSFLPPTLFFGSWVWAIAENVAYQKSSNNVVTQEGQMRSFLALAITAEVIVGLAILLGIWAIAMNDKRAHCYASGCSAAGWMIVIELYVGVPILFVTAFFIAAALAQKKNLSAGYRRSKSVLYHTIGLGVLSMLLSITIASAIFLLVKNR